MGLGRLGRGDHLFLAGLRAAVADVIPNRTGKEDGLLGHNPNLGQQPILVQVAHVLPSNLDGTARGIVKTRDQVD